MEITFGDQIKIDGEEVPEYLLKALYEWYQHHGLASDISVHCWGQVTSKISGGCIKTSSSRS